MDTTPPIKLTSITDYQKWSDIMSDFVAAKFPRIAKLVHYDIIPPSAEVVAQRLEYENGILQLLQTAVPNDPPIPVTNGLTPMPNLHLIFTLPNVDF